MKLFWALSLFLLSSISLAGQTSVSLSGKLIDKKAKEPIVAASLELLAPKDSVMIRGAVSDTQGSYTFSGLPVGQYILKVSYLGYLTIHKDLNLDGKQTAVKVEDLFLETNDILLAEALIEGKAPDVLVRGDTLEYDAGSFHTEQNAVLEALLKKLPGVEIDSDGNITAGGKNVGKILVEGEEFLSDDPKIAAKNLPAEMVQKVQVVDRKSEMSRLTGFDDGEEETIINLIIKEGMKVGTMGNVTLGAGRDINIDNDNRYSGMGFVNHQRNSDRYTVIVNANNNNNMGATDMGGSRFGGMRRGGGSGGITEAQNIAFDMNKRFSQQLNINGNIRFDNSDRYAPTKSETVTIGSTQSQVERSQSENHSKSQNLSASMEMRWNPDTLNTIIFRPNFAYHKQRSTNESLSSILDYDTNDSISSSDSWSSTKGNGLNFGGSLSYSHNFAAKAGRNFTINVSGSYSDDESWQRSLWGKDVFENNLVTKQESRNQRSESDNINKNISTNVSFVEPIGRSNFLQFSYRISYSDMEALSSTYDISAMDASQLEHYWNQVDTAQININQSNSTLRNNTNQRIGLSFKAVREKYDYTIGFTVNPNRSVNESYMPTEASVERILWYYPFDERLPNVKGDSLASSIKQNVVNYSPDIQFNYRFGQRSNLRVNYNGQTNQPSATQLRDYIDESNPNNLVQGNPDLKPGYQNNIRVEFRKFVPETQLNYNFWLNGSYSVNQITSVTTMLDEGVRLTTYENVNGNWNTNLRGMINTPLRNKKFSISNSANVGYENRNSYVNEVKNLMKQWSLSDNLRFRFQNNNVSLSVNGGINYSNINYSVNTSNNQNTFVYSSGGDFIWTLPHDWELSTDVNWSKRTGLASSEYNISQTIWNGAVSKQIFNKKIGVGYLKLQIYDILQDRNNVSVGNTTNGFYSRESLVLPSYFMCSFIYRFSIFPASSTATEEDMRPSGRGDFRGGYPGGGRPF